MKTLKILHFISHFRWLFMAWMIGLLLYIFLSSNEITPNAVGTTIFLAGIMMGLASLSDVSRMSDKEKRELSNPVRNKWQFNFLLIGAIFLVLISALFLSLKFIFPTADASFLNDFTKLGYDCLVMMLGMLCLMKQHIDRVSYVTGLKDE